MRATRLTKDDWIFLFAVIVSSRILLFSLALLYAAGPSSGRTMSDILTTWDIGWYLELINSGYHAFPTRHVAGDAANWAFFPLFPLIAKTLSSVSGFGGLLSGYIVANVSFGIAIIILFKFCMLKFDEATSRFIVIAMSLAPFTLYYSVPYTESLYNLFLVATVYTAVSGRWLLAGIFAAALSATRNIGVMIVIPLLVIALQQFGWKQLCTIKPGTEKAVTALLLAPLGLFLYMLYLHMYVGDAFAFIHIQLAWDRIVGNPVTVFANAFLYGGNNAKYCAFVAFLCIITGSCLCIKRYYVEGLIMLIGIIVPLSTSASSLPRYGLTLFPFYIALGVLTKNNASARTPILIVCSALSGFFIASWISAKGYMT